MLHKLSIKTYQLKDLSVYRNNYLLLPYSLFLLFLIWAMSQVHENHILQIKSITSVWELTLLTIAVIFSVLSVAVSVFVIYFIWNFSCWLLAKLHKNPEKIIHYEEKLMTYFFMEQSRLILSSFVSIGWLAVSPKLIPACLIYNVMVVSYLYMCGKLTHRLNIVANYNFSLERKYLTFSSYIKLCQYFNKQKDFDEYWAKVLFIREQQFTEKDENELISKTTGEYLKNIIPDIETIISKGNELRKDYICTLESSKMQQKKILKEQERELLKRENEYLYNEKIKKVKKIIE